MSLLRLGDADHAVLMTMHHLITDGWSFSVAASELAILYEAVRQDSRSSPLPDLLIHHGDFARWQAQPVRERKRVDGPDRMLEAPTCWRAISGAADGSPSPADPERKWALHQLVLSPELSAAVRAVSRREGLTPFMTLLAAFQVILGRWSGQDDFAVGTPIANRNRPETERLIGYFVNMIALRADLTGNPTTREFLARVREVAVEAFENQAVPLEVLIPALGPRRDPSRSPLFQVMFVLQNNALPVVDPRELAFSPLNLDQGNRYVKVRPIVGVRGHA